MKDNKNYKDLLGQSFGELTVVEKTTKRKYGSIVWKCQCSCGNVSEYCSRQLLRKYATQCLEHSNINLVGKKFHELTIQGYRRNTGGEVYLFCQCSCGNKIWIKRANLLNGHTKSCGHLKLVENRQKIDGTIPGLLRSRVSKNNTSGYKGVSKSRNDKWIASITLRGERYCLGTFSRKEDAIIARKNAEIKLYEPILSKECEHECVNLTDN